MNIFGFNINRNLRPAGSKDSASSQIFRQSSMNDRFGSMFTGLKPRKVSPVLYELLRETIPILDSALYTTSALDGLLKFDGNASLVAEVAEWAGTVRVNDSQIGEVGLQSFIDNFTNETYEQGFSISEYLTDSDCKNITQLNVADSKNIRFRQTIRGREVWLKGKSSSLQKDDLARVSTILRSTTGTLETSQLIGSGFKKLKVEPLLYYAVNNENSNPYGTSYLRSLEFVSRILLTIENSNLNAWERFGDPIFHISYKHGKSRLSKTELTERRDELAKTFKETIDAKRLGKSADWTTAVDANSEVVINVVGADNQILEIKEPMGHVMGQILSHFPVAPWMLGNNLGTTERLADREVDMVLQDATTRGAKKRLPIQSLVETMLKMRGRKFKQGDIHVYFELPNLHDVVKKAQARFLNAQADYYYAEYAIPIPAKSATPLIANEAPLAQKLTARRKSSGSKINHLCKEIPTIPSPILDRLMKEFADGLTLQWDALPTGIFRRLGIEDAQKNKMPDTKPPSDGEITTASAAEVALFLSLVTLNTTSEQGIIARSVDRAYSLGLLDAAKALAEQTPIGDIILNETSVTALHKNVFKLVKDKIFKDMEADIIPELQRIARQGGNPKDIPAKFREFFKSKNYQSNWRRLSRSELAIAHEVAKKDEWKAQGQKYLFYEPAVDACPICIALRGRYLIDACPIPVIDTHPNCRCARRLV